MMFQRKQGYALVLAVLMVGAIAMILTSVVNKVLVYSSLSAVLTNREQARLLALSGVQIAIAQIMQKSAVQHSNDTKTQQSELAVLLKKVEPIVNRWQKFTFTMEKEGLDGESDLYIACEQGKININQLYDVENKKFVKNAQVDGQKILQLTASKLPSMKGFAEKVAVVLKERGHPLQDLTQLLTDPELKKMSGAIFPSPELEICLFDLYTVETKKILLQPWFLSRSLNALLGFKNQDKIDKTGFAELFEKTKSVQNKVAWVQNWDTYLAPIYGKQYSTIEQDIKTLFDEEFEAPTFSVVSYGKFGKVVVKLYAILTKIEHNGTMYCIKKIYWI